MQHLFLFNIRPWLPSAAWMSVIFLFSTDIFSSSNTSSFLGAIVSALFGSLTMEQIKGIHFAMRKLSHWIEYFILALLLMRALREQVPSWKQSRRLVCCLVIAMLYAAGDEWHQSFVPSRSASLYDVLIDGLGALCGALCFERYQNKSSANQFKISNGV